MYGGLGQIFFGVNLEKLKSFFLFRPKVFLLIRYSILFLLTHDSLA